MTADAYYSRSFFQIISTFLRSLDVPWPSLFVSAVTRVNVVNLNLSQLPSASCMNPSPSYYREFQGYTLGLLVAVVTMGTVYAFGRRVLAPLALRGLPAAQRDVRMERFNSTCLARVLLLLYLVVRALTASRFAGRCALLSYSDARSLARCLLARCLLARTR